MKKNKEKELTDKELKEIHDFSIHDIEDFKIMIKATRRAESLGFEMKEKCYFSPPLKENCYYYFKGKKSYYYGTIFRCFSLQDYSDFFNDSKINEYSDIFIRVHERYKTGCHSATVIDGDIHWE